MDSKEYSIKNGRDSYRLNRWQNPNLSMVPGQILKNINIQGNINIRSEMGRSLNIQRNGVATKPKDRAWVDLKEY